MNDFERLIELVGQLPQDLRAISAALKEGDFSAEELMEAAVKAAETFDYPDACEEYFRKRNEDYDYHSQADGTYIKIYMKYDPAYMKEVRDHPMIKILRMLLDKGLDPNTNPVGEGYNVMWELQYVDPPYLGAEAMKLMLDHGADPYIMSEGETLFENIDGKIAIDIGLLPYDMVQPWIQCWYLLIGYGARPEKVEPFKLNSGHIYDELKEYEFFDWYIKYDPEKRENIMHITDIRTGEEVGTL